MEWLGKDDSSANLCRGTLKWFRILVRSRWWKKTNLVETFRVLSHSHCTLTVILMEDQTEELEPLFDYSRVQPIDVISLDDDDCSDSENLSNSYPKRMKKADTNCEEAPNVDKDKDEEEDWLLPPPKAANDALKIDEEDATIKELRLKKQELASFAQSAEDMLRAVEESAKRKHNSSEKSLDCEMDKPLKLHDDRVKIVVSIQDKDELKQFRIYMDDKFEKLFKMYSEKVKREMGGLVFSFDGDKVSCAETPAGLGMEDNDIIEVHIKSTKRG